MTTSMEPIYIIDGARTPFLKARNKPGPFAASDLATAAGSAPAKRVSNASAIVRPRLVDHTRRSACRENRKTPRNRSAPGAA